MTQQSDPRVDEYISQFPLESQKRMHALRAVIRKVFPTAIEDISYKMPAYRLVAGKRAVVLFSAYPNHIGLYAVLVANDSDLYKRTAPFNTGKGTLRFSNDAPLPIELIEEILTDHAARIVI